uniref:NET domain-containing protein n=1 Tax=viral metagenome TaxID=1070528 RepID=A0A6C0J2H6_9ZZZZ
MNKIELCKNIKDNIGKLSNNEILEIFKIVNDNNTKYTRNNNGIFINLKWMDEDILNKINDYIAFSIKSQNEMIKYEEIKNSLTDTINFKDKNSNDNTSNINDTSNINNLQISKSKISSSMKFYLLKKKFMKPILQQSIIIENDLTYEEYLI